MELAVSPTVPGRGAGDLAELCAWGEELGYTQSWLAEVAGPDAFVLAAAVALRTESMAVGAGVVPAYTRTPALLAMAAGSVSQLLNGRTFALGIGSSSEAVVAGWHGQPFARPLRRVRETVEAVRAALEGEGSFEGGTVAMHRYRTASPPAGPVPLYVGALGPRMLQTAGAVGDGVCLNLMPAEVVPRQLAEVAAGAAATGRELPDGFGVMARLQVVVTDDQAAARAALRRNMLGPYLAQPVYNRFLSWMGYREEADAIAGAWAQRDREALERAVPDRLIDDLALIGSASGVRERLEAFAEAGITVAALSVPVGDRVEETLRALAPGR